MESYLKGVKSKDKFEYLRRCKEIRKIKQEIRNLKIDNQDYYVRIVNLLKDYETHFKKLISLNNEFKKNPLKLANLK